MKSVLLVLSHYHGRSPGQRYRIEQYISFLAEAGFECQSSVLITPRQDVFFYRPGHHVAKLGALLSHYWQRRSELREIKTYDLVFIFREALLTRHTFFERGVARAGVPILFDLDDAIWLPNVSQANRRFGFLKDPEKTHRILPLASLVFAGNSYLADHVRAYNPNVWIVPTTIDTDLHKPGRSENNAADAPIVIGWSGSHTTLPHFRLVEPALAHIKQQYGSRVRFVVMGDAGYQNEELGIQGLAWSEKAEVPTLNSFDIGIMPLPDDEWSKGKCGLKALAYMAMETATVASPVGVNTEIIQHGQNGLLASSQADWVHQLSRLIEDAELRKRLGRAARQTVIERYSVHSQRDRYLQAFRQLTEKKTLAPT